MARPRAPGGGSTGRPGRRPAADSQPAEQRRRGRRRRRRRARGRSRSRRGPRAAASRPAGSRRPSASDRSEAASPTVTDRPAVAASPTPLAGIGYRTWIGPVTPRGPQGQRLVERRDAQAVDAGPDERRGDGHRPVAVGVRLDDRVDRGRPAGETPEQAQVGDERVEVDLEPGESRQRREPGGREAGLDGVVTPDRRAAAASPAGRAANPSRALLALRVGDRRQALARDREAVGQVRREDAGVAQPFAGGLAGQPVEVDAERAAASNGARPWARSEPIAPARTSPVPPLARAGFSNGAIATSPSGVAMTVRAPLSTTHWRQAAAASRTAATRASSSAARSPSASGSRPLPARSRANSPACGVRTAGRRSPSHQSSIVASDRSASASRRIGAWSGSSATISRRTSSAVARPGRRPGPMTIASCSWSRIAGVGRLRVQLLDVVLGQGHRRRLDDLRGEDRLEGLRHGQRHEPGPGPAGRARDQQGRAGVVERARDDEQLAERALVAAGRPLGEQARTRSRRPASSRPPGTARRPPARSTARSSSSRRPNPTGPDPAIRPWTDPRRGPPGPRPGGAPGGPGSSARDRRSAPRCRAGRRTGRRPSGPRTRSRPRSPTRG